MEQLLGLVNDLSFYIINLNTKNVFSDIKTIYQDYQYDSFISYKLLNTAHVSIKAIQKK